MPQLISLLLAQKSVIETVVFIGMTLVIVTKLVEDLSERGSQASPGHSFIHWAIRWAVFAVLITFVFGFFGSIPTV